MGKDWKYILYISLAFGLFLLLKLSESKQFNWQPTYASEDKNPFGAYVLRQALPELFKGKKINTSYKTVYELKDSLKDGDNLLILSHSFSGDKEDTKMLLERVAKGNSAFISAQNFYGTFGDTLHLDTDDYLFKNGLASQRQDTSYLRFVNPHLDTTQHFNFKRDNIHNFFSRYDTIHSTIIAENDFGQPVAIRTQWGKGNFILSTVPLTFTNIYSLKKPNYDFLASLLSYLPVENVRWTQYYSVGRMEAVTPLRFILTNEPLAWAYYITVLSLLLFMIFESKRKQRIIPVIPPLGNTSLEFVNVIGTLYYQRGDHKNIAEKKIVFLFEQIRTKYGINPNVPGEKFFVSLSKKAGKDLQTVQHLFKIIESIRDKISITSEELIELNTSIEKFTINSR